MSPQYTWKVQFIAPATTETTVLTVVCNRIEAAIKEIYDRWPDATIVSVVRQQQENEGGVIVASDGS